MKCWPRALDARMCEGVGSMSIVSSSSMTEMRDDEDGELLAVAMGISLGNRISNIQSKRRGNAQSPTTA